MVNLTFRKTIILEFFNSLLTNLISLMESVKDEEGDFVKELLLKIRFDSEVGFSQLLFDQQFLLCQL